MSEESQKNPRMGRPGVSTRERGRIFGELAVSKKGTAEYRRTRLELALEFAISERRIEQIYDEVRGDFLGREAAAVA